MFNKDVDILDLQEPLIYSWILVDQRLVVFFSADN